MKMLSEYEARGLMVSYRIYCSKVYLIVLQVLQSCVRGIVDVLFWRLTFARHEQGSKE
jgi:hypothetical protein